MKKISILLVALFLLLVFNLSNFPVTIGAQESHAPGGQQLTLTPIGKGTYTELFDVEGLSGPYFPENWQYAKFADSKILRVHMQDERATDTYELSDHDPTKQFGNIYSVEIVVHYSSYSGHQGIAGAINTNGMLFTAEEHVINEIKEGDIYSEITINPVTAEPWTWENIDNLEAGATLFIGDWTSASINFDQVFVIVNYGLDATIFTNPADCNVTINNITINSGLNGASLTGLTPFTTYDVTVSKQYFYPKTETLLINDTSIQLTISLIPSHYRLSINTNPENCKVLIDGIETASVMVPPNTSHTITVSKGLYFYEKEETVTVENHNLTIQMILDPSPIPNILFGLIGLVFFISVIVLFKNRKRIAKWNETRCTRIAQEDPVKRRERRRNIILILLIAVIVALLSALYFLGGVLGFALSLVNVAIILGFIYGYRLTDNLTIIGVVITTWLGLIVTLYAIGSPSLGLIVLVGMIGGVFLVLVALAINSDAFWEILRDIKYNSRYKSENIKYQKKCVKCGRHLKTRRKYCYECRPWGTRTPKEEDSRESIFAPAYFPRRSTNRSISNSRERDYVHSPKRSTRKLIGDTRERDYVGDTYSNKSLEDHVGKRKKRRYF